MTIYKRGLTISIVLTISSIVIAMILHYGFREQFWCNVMLGVFGSSLLTLITSDVGYFVERRFVLEEFYTKTIKILNKFNRYQSDFSLEQKIDFFLEMTDYDTTDWNMLIGKMDFFRKENRVYIYNKIYKPLVDVYKIICSYSCCFRQYVNGIAKNEDDLMSCIKEIEPYILKKVKDIVGSENEQQITVSSISNRLMENMIPELYGKYYEIMYGKKKARKKAEEKKSE